MRTPGTRPAAESVGPALARSAAWRRRLTVAIAFLLATGATILVFRGVLRGHFIALSGYHLTDHDSGGLYTVVFVTNLPDGTLVADWASSPDVEGGSSSFLVARGGEIRYLLANNTCSRHDGTLQGSVWDVTLTVAAVPPRPFISGPPGRPHIPSPRQPDNVYAELGERFERLRGFDVQEKHGQRMLVHEEPIEFPADTCVPN